MNCLLFIFRVLIFAQKVRQELLFIDFLKAFFEDDESIVILKVYLTLIIKQ
jgi:hypothetical protein